MSLARWSRRIVVAATCLGLGSVLLAGSPATEVDAGSADPVIATFETADGSTFRALLDRPEDIARAEAALEAGGNAGIPNGALASGDGGVNAPHRWHLVGVELVDVTIELCDGTATMVDEDLDYWLGTVGRFCPWNATLIALVPAVSELPEVGVGWVVTPGWRAVPYVVTILLIASVARLRRWPVRR